VHPVSRDKPIEQLNHLRSHAGPSSILFVTVDTTSDGLLAGATAAGDFRLDYVQAGWFDFVRLWRYLSFCKSRKLPVLRERWGNETIFRAQIGQDVGNAADYFDACFRSVYGHAGPYAVTFLGVGWQSPNTPSADL
jgi:hypothetical protein